jgi:hypothetical protein
LSAGRGVSRTRPAVRFDIPPVSAITRLRLFSSDDQRAWPGNNWPRRSIADVRRRSSTPPFDWAFTRSGARWRSVNPRQFRDDRGGETEIWPHLLRVSASVGGVPHGPRSNGPANFVSESFSSRYRLNPSILPAGVCSDVRSTLRPGRGSGEASHAARRGSELRIVITGKSQFDSLDVDSRRSGRDESASFGFFFRMSVRTGPYWWLPARPEAEEEGPSSRCTTKPT